MKNRDMVKRIVWLIILSCLIGIMCAEFFLIHRLNCNQKNLLMEYQRAKMPEIVCIGDSLTYGTGGYSYPEFLQENMRQDNIYSNVVNLGVGGENTVTIAGRMGAIPFIVEEFIIPMNTVPVEVKFISERNKNIAPMIQGDSGINPCTIAEIEGKLYSQQNQDGSYSYYFERKECGVEQRVETGTQVVTHAKERYKNGIFIVFMGENNGFDDISNLIEQQQAILTLQKGNAGKYLILGMSSGTAEERRDLESKMQETYGEYYINLREYLSTDGPMDAGVVISEKDMEQMSQGIVPDCLRTDGVHYTKEGYKLVANLVYERMNKLGYFNEIKEITNQYSSFWKSVNW